MLAQVNQMDHRTTSFRWRHRFLTWIKLDRPTVLQGITEADETYLLESNKGSRKLDRRPRKRGGQRTKHWLSKEQISNLVARDRSGYTFDFITGRGPVSKAQFAPHTLNSSWPTIRFGKRWTSCLQGFLQR